MTTTLYDHQTAKPLRDYQRRAIDDLTTHLDLNPVLVMPTGGGKTRTAAEFVREQNLPTLWLAHRRELVGQAAESLRNQGLSVGVIQAGYPFYASRMVQVASVQTLARREFPKANRIIVDECHHTPGATFRKILEHYTGVPRVGLTATPFRLDGRPLGDLFGHLVVAAHADELVSQGLLIEPKVFAPHPAVLKGIRIAHGDYEIGGLARICDKPQLIGDIVETWKARAAGRRTVVFAVNVEHSKHIIESFVAAGIPAEHLDGKTPKAERDAALARLASGKTLVLSNCQCLTEGWDLPALECAIIARPTASLCLHLQTVGRIMRSCPGKTGAIVLDHAGNFIRHGRVTRRIEYSLDGPTKSMSAGSGLRTCPSCYRMVLSSRTRCPECGLVFATATGRDMPTTQDGDLQEYTGDETPAPVVTAEQKLAYFDELSAQAADRGWKTGAIAYKFKERFGIWPTVVTVDGAPRLAVEGADEAVQAAALAKFEEDRREKDFKPGYASARFKNTFGRWPSRKVKQLAGLSEPVAEGAAA